MPRRISPFILLSLLSVVATASAATLARTSDGRTVECTLTLPPGQGRVPCLVVCPGRGYHRGRPLFTDLSRQAEGAGLACLVLDWHYFTSKAAPSRGLAREVLDVHAALRLAREHPRVDPAKIVIAGKSFGSVVAHRVFHRDPSLRGLILFTPLVPKAVALSEYYGSLVDGSRPVAIVVGQADSANCPLGELYRALQGCRHPAPVVVVGGDHGLNLGDFRDPSFHAINAANVAAANAAALHWVRLWLGHGR